MHARLFNAPRAFLKPYKKVYLSYAIQYNHTHPHQVTKWVPSQARCYKVNVEGAVFTKMNFLLVWTFLEYVYKYSNIVMY